MSHVYLVRHSEAGARGRWVGPDRGRPLSEAGRRQAARLVEVFAERPVARLLASPYVRCVQTLEPLAAARGLPIEECEELAEGMSWTLVEKLAIEWEPDGPLVMCTHGDVLRGLIEDLDERGVALHESPLDLRKGVTWVLEVLDDSIVSARRLAPPPAVPGRLLSSRPGPA